MTLYTEVGLGPVHIVLDRDTAPRPKKGTEPPIFGPSLLWPTCWMHQDASWYGLEVGLSPGDFVLDGDAAPTTKGAEPHPIFGPRPLWPNCCMDQDATS